MVKPVFLFGTLRDPQLLDLVAGEPVVQEPAVLHGWRIAGVDQAVYPVLVRSDGDQAQGAVIRVSQKALDRLVHYEDAFGYDIEEIEVVTDAGPEQALVFQPIEGGPAPHGDWALSDWQASSGARSRFAAQELMSYMGRFSGGALQFRRAQAEARAHSRVEATQMPRPWVGTDIPASEVQVKSQQADHAGYFVTETIQLRHPTFQGGLSEEITREVFVAAEAVILLPYDPVRDRILLVEQFRMGPWRRGATYPWMLEPVAGRVDPGETPESTARREAVEEAGLTLRGLERIGSGYPTPGYSTEYFHVFLGLCDLPDGIEGHHGEAEEHEDIRTHVLDWAQAEDLLSRGEADNMPLVLALVWLSRERSRLRATA